jgi:hypothetical protein
MGWRGSSSPRAGRLSRESWKPRGERGDRAA